MRIARPGERPTFRLSRVTDRPVEEPDLFEDVRRGITMEELVRQEIIASIPSGVKDMGIAMDSFLLRGFSRSEGDIIWDYLNNFRLRLPTKTSNVVYHFSGISESEWNKTYAELHKLGKGSGPKGHSRLYWNQTPHQFLSEINNAVKACGMDVDKFDRLIAEYSRAGGLEIEDFHKWRCEVAKINYRRLKAAVFTKSPKPVLESGLVWRLNLLRAAEDVTPVTLGFGDVVFDGVSCDIPDTAVEFPAAPQVAALVDSAQVRELLKQQPG